MKCIKYAVILAFFVIIDVYAPGIMAPISQPNQTSASSILFAQTLYNKILTKAGTTIVSVSAGVWSSTDKPLENSNFATQALYDNAYNAAEKKGLTASNVTDATVNAYLTAAAGNADNFGDITDGDSGPILAGLKAAFNYTP